MTARSHTRTRRNERRRQLALSAKRAQKLARRAGRRKPRN